MNEERCGIRQRNFTEFNYGKSCLFKNLKWMKLLNAVLKEA